jgi:hypothetical protein
MPCSHVHVIHHHPRPSSASGIPGRATLNRDTSARGRVPRALSPADLAAGIETTRAFLLAIELAGALVVAGSEALPAEFAQSHWAVVRGLGAVQGDRCALLAALALTLAVLLAS